MSRFWRPLLCASLLLGAGCTIERTPDEYIDPAASAVAEQELAAEELRDRLRALASALNRSSISGAVAALAPARNVQVLTPESGDVATGDSALISTLQQLVEQRGRIQVQGLQMTLGPRANLGWFAGLVEVGEPAAPDSASLVRATGVFVLDEGNWRLAQLHLSRAARAN